MFGCSGKSEKIGCIGVFSRNYFLLKLWRIYWTKEVSSCACTRKFSCCKIKPLITYIYIYKKTTISIENIKILIYLSKDIYWNRSLYIYIYIYVLPRNDIFVYYGPPFYNTTGYRCKVVM